MSTTFAPVFECLRDVLKRHAEGFSVSKDDADYFCLEGPVGPATLQAWKGKEKTRTIPVAWVQVSKSYVSFHLMGVYGQPKLLEDCSPELRSRMQGKSCFNFKTIDEPLFEELEQLTVESLAGMKKAGFVS
jgi:hypothetical protein